MNNFELLNSLIMNEDFFFILTKQDEIGKKTTTKNKRFLREKPKFHSCTNPHGFPRCVHNVFFL